MQGQPAPAAPELRGFVAGPADAASDPLRFRLGHHRALDGLRGVAVFAVLAFHARLPGATGGFLGVDAFFVLSGFLITSLLYEEWQRAGGFSFRAFYARRALRLLPALLLLLIVLVAYAACLLGPGQRDRLYHEVFYTVFYVANWAQAFALVSPLGFLSHAWSLAIEEQFYLVWPFTLGLLLRPGVGRWRALGLLALAIAVSTTLRAHLWHGDDSFRRVFFGSDTRADEPLIGCALALALAWWGPPASRGGRAVVRGASAVGALVLIGMATRTSWVGGYMYHGGFTVAAACVAAVILAATTIPGDLVGRILTTAALVGLGRISYGVYLWHWPIFVWLRPEVLGWGTVATAVVRFAATIAVAVVSFAVLERPFLLLKHRFSRVRD